MIHKNDSVVVSIEEIAKGDLVTFRTETGEEQSFQAIDAIPLYHKVALKDIPKGEQIKKYGENIGVASEQIEKGKHVHEHNVESVREDLHV